MPSCSPRCAALGAIEAPSATFGVGIVPDDAATAAVEDGLDRLVDPTASWDAGQTYTNFVHRPAGGRRCFADAAPARLRAVREQVDPDRLFMSNHPF